MNTLLLLKYFNCHTTDNENQKIWNWIANDPDGSHRQQYRSARFIYNGFILHNPVTEASSDVHERTSGKLPVWKKVLWVCGNVAAAVILIMGTFWFAEKTTIENMSENMVSACVPEGKTYELILEDGTSMFMNSNTQVEYPTAFSRKERKVRVLHGEVFFNVSKEDRPFIVETFASDVRVLGTSFNLEVQPQNDYFSTELITGSVQLKNNYNEKMVVLEPSMRALIDHGTLQLEKIEDPSTVVDWTKGMINLSGLDFEQLMEKYERAFGLNIVIDKKEIPEISFTRGKVRVSDGIEHALNVVKMAADFEYERNYQTNTIIIH